jgi:4-amino-4-deoxychorismate lyase
VFDTAKLIDGHIYQIAEHLDRFLWSSGKAGIQPPMTLEQMTRTILDTAAASNAANGETCVHMPSM